MEKMEENKSASQSLNQYFASIGSVLIACVALQILSLTTTITAAQVRIFCY
jgi:hypothetical protein